MKRAGVIFFGAVFAAVLTAALDVDFRGGLGSSANEAAAACSPDFQVPGCPINPPPTTPLPSGDPLVNGGCVKVALPIFAGTGCIPNDPKTGGSIIYYLKLILRLLNGVIGAIIILVLVIAGIQYITSAGEPANVKKAKDRIVQAITALVMYLMMFAILNFLVPGGILK